MTAKQWMFWILSWILVALDLGRIAQGQTATHSPVKPQVVGRPIRDGQVTTVFLAPRYVTAIRMPEPVNSVVVGDPASFSAEHSDREPNLVFVKPITTKAAQTNLLISSTRGLQASLLLITRGEPKDDEQRGGQQSHQRLSPQGYDDWSLHAVIDTSDSAGRELRSLPAKAAPGPRAA